jgi:hypothetical protein
MTLLFGDANGRCRGQGCTDKATNTPCSIVIQKAETASAALLHFQSTRDEKIPSKDRQGCFGVLQWSWLP